MACHGYVDPFKVQTEACHGSTAIRACPSNVSIRWSEKKTLANHVLGTALSRITLSLTVANHVPE